MNFYHTATSIAKFQSLPLGRYAQEEEERWKEKRSSHAEFGTALGLLTTPQMQTSAAGPLSFSLGFSRRVKDALRFFVLPFSLSLFLTRLDSGPATPAIHLQLGRLQPAPAYWVLFFWGLCRRRPRRRWGARVTSVLIGTQVRKRRVNKYGQFTMNSRSVVWLLFLTLALQRIDRRSWVIHSTGVFSSSWST